MHQVVELQFDEQTERLLQNARMELFDRGLVSQPDGKPHLSLSSFAISDRKAWETYFTRIANQEYPHIEFSHVDVFSGETFVIYLGVIPSTELRLIQEMVHEHAVQEATDLNEHFFPQRVVFHSTLGISVTSEALPKAIEVVSNLELPQKGRAIRLSLVEYSPARVLLEKEFEVQV